MFDPDYVSFNEGERLTGFPAKTLSRRAALRAENPPSPCKSLYLPALEAWLGVELPRRIDRRDPFAIAHDFPTGTDGGPMPLPESMEHGPPTPR
jgi:hypothetical protein